MMILVLIDLRYSALGKYAKQLNIPTFSIFPTYDDVINRYNNLIGRINSRVLNALSPIDYSEARGTLTQLVTSTSI